MKPIKEEKYVEHDDGHIASNDEVLSLLDKITEVTNSEKGNFVSKQDICKVFKISDSELKITGSREAIRYFLNISNKKYDYILSLNNIDSIDFIRESSYNSDESYLLRFNVIDEETKKILIPGVLSYYDSKKKFLDLYFSMAKYGDFALHHDSKDLILSDISTLRQKASIANKEVKFRFIDDDKENKTYLRGLVGSEGYKNYDNAIVFYIALVKINEFAKQVKSSFRISNMIVTDSKINLFFSEVGTVNISKNISISTGIKVSNSELGDGAAIFKMFYTIHNKQGKSIRVLAQELTKIVHNANVEKINTSLSHLNNFTDYRKDIIAVLKTIEWDKKLTKSDDQVLKLTTIVGHLKIERGFTDRLKEEIKSSEVIKDTFTLLDVFDLMSKMSNKKQENLQFILEGKFQQIIEKMSK